MNNMGYNRNFVNSLFAEICFYQTCHILFFYRQSSTIPVAVLSKVWVCGPSLAGIAGLNPARWAWMPVSCECGVLSV
jgi:hypothetical protein